MTRVANINNEEERRGEERRSRAEIERKTLMPTLILKRYARKVGGKSDPDLFILPRFPPPLPLRMDRAMARHC